MEFQKCLKMVSWFGRGCSTFYGRCGENNTTFYARGGEKQFFPDRSPEEIKSLFTNADEVDGRICSCNEILIDCEDKKCNCK